MVKYFCSGANGLERKDTFLPKCWVDMVSPTDDEVEDVAKETGVPEDMIKAALNKPTIQIAPFIINLNTSIDVNH